MYRVIELNQARVPSFRGKIVQVIAREERRVVYPLPHSEWVLVCLVEEKEEYERKKKN
jgi:hypothetical protein